MKQLLCHRTARYRSPPPPHLAPARKAVHPVLFVPDPPWSQVRPLSRRGASGLEAVEYLGEREL